MRFFTSLFLAVLCHITKIVAALFIFILLLCNSQQAFAQITITNGATPLAIAQRLTGQGVKIQNVVITGSNLAYGLYETSSTSNELGALKIGRGLAMACGNVASMRGNSSGNVSTNFGLPGDATLTSMAGVSTFDAITIQFEVIPSGSSINFEYTFGSEEYPEYAPPITSSFNDVFGFFISGPGIVGERNIALLPNSNTIVAINTVNPVTNNQYYYSNSTGNILTYDGFIRNLSAVATNLLPCQVYKVKLKIADGGDGILDSGVFIEQVSSKSMEADVASCTAMNIVRTVATSSQTVGLSYVGSAITNNVVSNLPTSVNVPVGATNVNIPFTPNYNNVVGVKNTLTTYFLDICNGTIFDTVNIDIYKPVRIQTPNLTICDGTSTELDAGAGYPTYQWSTGATTQKITVSNAGTYHVSIPYGKNCLTRDTVKVNVLPRPLELLPYSTISEFCVSGTTDIIVPNSEIGYSYQLINEANGNLVGTAKIGTGNSITLPTPLITQSTTFSVRVMTNTTPNCVRKLNQTVLIKINPSPTATFATSLSEPCETMPLVTINNTSVAATGATYLWDFGNGQTSNLQNPAPFRYAAAGNYNITLTVRNANGCETIRTNPITIVAGNPIISTISPLQRICETASTPLLATGGTSYTWTPATGLSATNIANPTASPSITTTYSVVISNGICQKTETVTVEVNQKPTATFATSLSEPCETMPLVTLNNTSTAAAGATYLWDFGNGQTSNLQNPAPFRYAAAGNYNITLTVRNANGCETTRVNPITIVAGNPIISTISPLQRICETASTPLLATGGTSYVWTPATGLSATNIANPTANPSVTTTYSVVISNGVCQKTETVTVEVNPKPIVNFATSLSEPCEAMPLVTINNTSVAATGATYLWDFGNGQTSNLQNPAPFRYAAAGNYNITLTVRNPNGCETVKTIVHQAIANPIINPQVSPNQAVCIGRPVTLSASGGVNYSWTPSTGLSNPNIANPIATPSITTTYTVRVDNGLGCFRDVSTTLTVAPNPTADFTLQVVDSCSLFPTVLLRNLSTNATSFLWDFGNGVRSNQFSPTINYTQAGNYTIRLYAYNGATCASTAQKNVEIRQNSLIQPVIQPVRAICKGDSVQLQASGGTRYLWSPATGLSNPNIANPKASPSQSTTYTLSIFNQFNCRKDTSVTVQVFPSIAANFDVLLTENCTRFPLVNLRNLSFPLENIRFLWDFGNGQTSTLQNPAPFRYANEGTYTIRLRVSNAGCVVEKSYQLAYKENTDFDFVQRISTSKNPKICAGDSTQLFATGGTTYLWSPTLGLSAANIANPIAFPKTTTLYTVRINNALGCFKDTSILVTVAPKVQADFVVSLVSSCEDEFPLVRIIPTLQNGESYLWTFGNDSSYVGEKPPAFRYTKAGTYTIKVRGFNQICEQTQSKTVKIERNDVDFAKKIKILPQKPTICEGEVVQLQVTGGTKYLWTPATGLNNPTIANPIAKPTVTTRYQVRISNERGCFMDSSILVVVAPNIKPDFELQVTSECGKNGTVKFINRSTGTGEYKWTLGNGEELKGQNPADYGFEKSGEYEIILEIFNGVCRKTKSQKVKIETVKPANVITPNGDGKNDKFILDMLEEGWKIEIYDRNGALKFKSDNYQNDWGQDVNSGTYYYLLISPSGKTCKGWIQVLEN